MNVPQLRDRLDELGVSVSLEGTNLRVLGPTKVITPELTRELRLNKPALIESLTQECNGTHIQQLVRESRSKRLLEECRSKAVNLQVWLTDHTVEHMRTEPFGMPEWISAMAEFDYVERNQLRRRFQYQGCIHDDEACTEDAAVNCTDCEGRDE